MMGEVLTANDFFQLKQHLPAALAPKLTNEQAVLSKAYPLLDLFCTDRELFSRTRTALNALVQPSAAEINQQINSVCQSLKNSFAPDALFRYRLPVVLSEFTVHSQAVNQAIAQFNLVVEANFQDSDEEFDLDRLREAYAQVLTVVQKHADFCIPQSLYQLLMMMAGWSTVSPLTLFTSTPQPAVTPVVHQPTEKKPVLVHEITQPAVKENPDPFTEQYDFNLNGAGRLAHETAFLLLNAFGMKFGGHFDAQVKHPPQFIPVEQLHAVIRRQLSHRMILNTSQAFELWIEKTLFQLGVKFHQKNENDLNRDLLINPFLEQPLSFLSPEKIRQVLKATHSEDECPFNETEFTILAHYLFELLHSFQMNPGIALGIGANWDGTINASNESGTHAFKFNPREDSWGRRFKELSLHRQGPSEARMNAALGVKFEFQGFFTSFEHMSQLQPTEYGEAIYNALVDNLTAHFLPEPAYFENAEYPKASKQHVVQRTAEGTVQIGSFLMNNPNGTYFKDKEGHEKQTPMYRQAGTLDVRAFPRNTTYSEQSRVCYAGNPLGPLQLQYAQAMYSNVRGHVVYNPVGPDLFLEDPFYGQVIRGEHGELLPFIGVIPKNFDKSFKQEPELCASFVVRMLHSSRIMEYCPTFKTTFEDIQTRFLPETNKVAPNIPLFGGSYLKTKHQLLLTELNKPNRSFVECQSAFHRLFKNTVYRLYSFGMQDEHFKRTFLAYVQSPETFLPMSRAKYSKIIRELTVNKPVQANAESIKRYEQLIVYLNDLTSFFYPAPSEALAQEIAKQAKIHMKPLLNSANVRAYFAQMAKNQQSNFSRKQSPGMLYAALKHGGPSPTVHSDYTEMHEENFHSFYRDPDGMPHTEPQSYESSTDGLTKFVGATAQVIHRYNLFAALRKPFVEPYIQARAAMAKVPPDDPNRTWHGVGGAVKGLFWDGIILGAWQTISTPFHMVYDFFHWQFEANRQNTPLPNPLAFSAAPRNEPQLKTYAVASSRDFLLSLLAHPANSQKKMQHLQRFIMKLLVIVYPHFTDKELALCLQEFKDNFPLNDSEWDYLFKPLLSEDRHLALAQLLQKHCTGINKNLTQAVFRCLTHPDLLTHTKKVCKETSSFFFLTPYQDEILIEVIALYQQPRQQKSTFAELFRFNGYLYLNLKKRDQAIQKLQGAILKLFDSQRLKELLFNAQIDEFINQLNPEQMDAIITRTPESIKKPLEKVLVTDNFSVLDQYDLNPKESAFLKHCLTLYQKIVDHKVRQHILNLCRTEDTSSAQMNSIKEQAQNHWTKFAKKELAHQLLSPTEFNDVLRIINKEQPALADLTLELKEIYQLLDPFKDESINRFYRSTNNLIAKITVIESPAKNVLVNFLNVTMNAVVNSRLARVNVLQGDKTSNPLTASALEAWLFQVQKNRNDLQSLLAQQMETSPSLDHALWRCDCIFATIEQQKNGERLAKTRMQSVLRFWMHHPNRVRVTGDEYIDPESGEQSRRSDPSFFSKSITMKHAVNKVQTKMGSFF